MRKTLPVIGFVCLLLVLSLGKTVHAAQTTPAKIAYNGHLLTSGNAAITTAHTIRFSYWTSADAVSGDTNGDGSINTGAANYAGWYEEHTVTPDANGYFSVELGSINALPDFIINTTLTSTLLSLYLQVDVKAASSPATAYELLDVNSGNTSLDRSPVLSVPFALNAEYLDQREIGTGSGSIPLLQSGGLLSSGAIPGGTAQSKFTIDVTDTLSGTGEIVLQFGNSLAKTLSYDINDGTFNFNDDLKVNGNLTVTGLINGVDISTLTSSTDTYLKVSSGAGLNITVGGGSYRINGVVTNYGGQSGVAVAANTTNYVYLTGTGLVVSQSSFPADKAILQLAEVTTGAAAVSGIADRRVLSSDDRGQIIQRVYQPMYEGASLSSNSGAKIGRMRLDFDSTNQTNYYNWSTTQSSLQEYDISVLFTIPDGFTAWESTSLSVNYRTLSATAADNHLDIAVFDTAGNPVTLTGTATNLAGTSWTTASLGFSGTPTWTEGDEILIRFRVFARNNQEVHLGKATLNYSQLTPAP